MRVKITAASLLAPTVNAWRFYLDDQAVSPHTTKAFMSDLNLLAAYLPRQASADEVAAEIDAALAAAGAAGPQDMGKVMGILKPRLAGRADLGAVSAQVRARLAPKA